MSDASMYCAMEAGMGAYCAYDPNEEEAYKELKECEKVFIGTLNEKLLNEYKEYDEYDEYRVVSFISDYNTSFNKKQLQAAVDYMSTLFYYKD